MAVDLIIRNALVFTEGGLIPGGVAVDDGRIVAICDDSCLPSARETVDAHGRHLLPGGVDPHVHVREPAPVMRESFLTGTMSAAQGGVTTICEHPISMPPQYSPEILARRVETAKRQSLVDFAFLAAAGANRMDHIAAMGKEPVVAFKTFFHEPPEGRAIEFDGLTMENDAQIFEGFRAVAATGKILVVHAENNDLIQANIDRFRQEGKVSPIDHALSRPPVSEIEAVAKVLLFARATGLRVELAHISTPEAMELVKQARAAGQEVYLETCPHYLLLSEDDLERLGPYAKCNPPLRNRSSVEKLWDYIADGTIDIVGSDHGPYLVPEKEKGWKDIFAAPAGFPGVDSRLPLFMDAVNKGRLSLTRAVDLISTAPAKLYGLYPKKGAIRVGADADFVIVDMDREFTVDRQKMLTLARDSSRVYDGWKLRGTPIMTLVRGKVVMKDGVVDQGNAGWGQWVKPCGIL